MTVGDITANFSWHEFASKDGAPFPASVRERIERELAPALQRIRDEIGVPLRITSGYRSPEHNARVGGAKRSQHMFGLAADIQMARGHDTDRLAEVIDRLIEDGEIPEGGVGLYRGWVHYDVRGTRARWDKR